MRLDHDGRELEPQGRGRRRPGLRAPAALLPLLVAMLAVVLGGLAAWVAAPVIRARADLSSIVSVDPVVRRTAWHALRADPRRLDRVEARLDRALGAAGPDAVLDAAGNLDAAGRWSWSARAPQLVAAACAAAVARDPADPLARRLLLAAPRHVPRATMMPVWQLLLARADDAEARAAAMGWVGPGHPDAIDALAEEALAAHLPFLRDAAALSPRPPERSDQVLETDPSVEAIEADPERAAVSDRRRQVIGAALAAERFVATSERASLAEAWIRSLDDDRRRAGALLSALLGAHRDLVQSTYDRENDGRVRLALAMALWALGASPAGVDARELAHRALRPDGMIDDDVLTAGLLAGDRAMLLVVVEWPAPEDLRRQRDETVRLRSRILARTVPTWHAALLEDAAVLGLDRALARLEARAFLEWRWLRHDAHRGRWVPSDA